MNWSLETADRVTHLKIIVVGLSTAIVISLIAIAATELHLSTLTAQGPTVIKAGSPLVFTERDGLIVR